jgi:hypothetical protein
VRVRNAIISRECNDVSGGLPNSMVQRMRLSLSAFEYVMNARFSLRVRRYKSRCFIGRIVIDDPYIPRQSSGVVGSEQSLELLRAESLADSYTKCLQIFEVLQHNRRYINLNPKGEPQLGKRGLMTRSAAVPMRKAFSWQCCGC